MRSLSHLDAAHFRGQPLWYLLASLAFAGLYWAAFCFIDSLPCQGFLCNLEWLMALFGPILAVSILAPLANYGLLHWERNRPDTRWLAIRLFLSTIGSGFSLLLFAVFVSSLAQDGLNRIDLSPQSLILAVLFITLTWLNLHCARLMLRKSASRAGSTA